MTATLRSSNLLGWFSIVSLGVVLTVAVVSASLVSRYVVNDAVERDTVLSAQFIQALAAAEMRHGDLGSVVTMGEFFDSRLDAGWLGVPREQLVHRDEFYDHLRNLPEARQVSMIASDRVIVWSTVPELVGQRVSGNDRLDEALQSRRMVADGVVSRAGLAHEVPAAIGRPTGLQIDSYIPIVDHAGNVVAVVEIHKEPDDLLDSLRRAHLLLWLVVALGAILLYLGLFWIVRRGAVVLKAQQTQLVESETLVALGGMSAAVAQGLRNPLAQIRSRAEKALQGNGAAARDSVGDIIGQVDQLSRWVRELLLYSRPLGTDSEPVDLARAVGDALRVFDRQIGESEIDIEWIPRPYPRLPRVLSQSALLAQALTSVFSNAIDAMAGGGRLRLRFEVDQRNRWVQLSIADSGPGMSEQQLAMAFKPFQATRSSGICVGLALVRRIMERFDGTVRLRSRLGEGTEISLRFRIANGD